MENHLDFHMLRKFQMLYLKSEELLMRVIKYKGQNKVKSMLKTKKLKKREK